MTSHFPSTLFSVNSPYKSSFSLLKHKSRGKKTQKGKTAKWSLL